MSLGWRRSSSTSGTVAADSHARVTQADRQPWLLMSAWVRDTNSAPPTPRPSCTMPVARPRSRMNHLDTGTVAISAPPAGAVQPVMPRPGPWRSSQRPIRMPLRPLAHRRMVCAQPIAWRERPSSSAIGMTKKPKLSVPLAWPAALSTKNAATITHP